MPHDTGLLRELGDAGVFLLPGEIEAIELEDEYNAGQDYQSEYWASTREDLRMEAAGEQAFYDRLAAEFQSWRLTDPLAYECWRLCPADLNLPEDAPPGSGGGGGVFVTVTLNGRVLPPPAEDIPF